MPGKINWLWCHQCRCVAAKCTLCKATSCASDGCTKCTEVFSQANNLAKKYFLQKTIPQWYKELLDKLKAKPAQRGELFEL